MGKFSFFNHYQDLSSKEILVSYKGPMSDVIIYEISKELKNKLAQDPKSGKKVYSIFMELAQNIFFYSSEVSKIGDKEYRVGTIVITEDEEFYTLMAGNLVEKKWIPTLWDKCELINTLDREALRRLKFEQRINPNEDERSKGAGIGLIQIALTSAQPISVEFRDVDDKLSFFALAVNVKKNL